MVKKRKKKKRKRRDYGRMAIGLGATAVGIHAMSRVMRHI